MTREGHRGLADRDIEDEGTGRMEMETATVPEDHQPSVLVVDDNARNLQVLGNILKTSGFRVGLAMDAERAFRFTGKIKPDLVLLDVMMPDMDGYQVCGKLKADPGTREIPVIFISALNEAEDKVRGFEAGGVDYITKPFHQEEVLARIRTHIELKRTREQLKAAFEELQRVNARLESAARTDTLTRISNRRDITEKMAYESARSVRNGRPFSLILADIDDFKRINDSYGHDCGDQVLVHVARTIRSRLRKQDVLARWGGEEFLMLLPETGATGAGSVAEAIQGELRDHRFEHDGRPLSVSMTYGISVFSPENSVEQCIKLADEALYQGKGAGKDRIVISGE